jgi:hypothetical protein
VDDPVERLVRCLVSSALGWATTNSPPLQRLDDNMGSGNIHTEQYWECPHISQISKSGRLLTIFIVSRLTVMTRWNSSSG